MTNQDRKEAIINYEQIIKIYERSYAITHSEFDLNEINRVRQRIKELKRTSHISRNLPITDLRQPT